MTQKTFVQASLSPYRLAKVLSEALGREVRPQMLYSYTRPNESGEARIPTSKSETGHQVVSAEDANTFINDFIARQAAREEKAAAKEAEAEVPAE
jgi:hypothetical protein